jgi:tetratricopeptide (TPR) repeat protein
MALTTVAAVVPPDETLAKLPPSHPERFQRSDFIAAAIVFFVTLGVYITTLAPNVTLEDSGELITAAAKFGVGHPPGYPLWTMSGFLLSHLLPFGGLAWRINLLCAIFGAISNAVLTLLACHSGRWLLQRWTEPQHQAAVRPYVFYVGIFVGLVIGFSDVMWSQAVISAVHGTLNALFVNLTLLSFYLWMIEPKKTHRLVLTVFIFSLGLTNHHTLVQIIPAFLLAAALEQITPAYFRKPANAPSGTFFSVFLAVNLFSLSILIYISWLSGFAPDKANSNDLQTISQAMAKLILGCTIVVSFFYLKQFRLHLFLLGAATAVVIFAYGFYLLEPNTENALRHTSATATHFWQIGSYVDPGWLQGLVANARAGHSPAPRHYEISYLGWMLFFTMLALGLLYTSQLNRRLVIGVFLVGWIGLIPYSYEPFASGTHPPMNWGYAKEKSGFYYEVSREQYPKSLPTLIKITFGKAIGVVAKDYNPDTTIGQADYWGRLWKTAYYYGDNLQLNFTVPLIFLTLAILFYVQRFDWPQINWFIFLIAAFFLLGFMLLIIAPQEGFDIERNLQYKVFHLQSHCIFVLLMGYGALALMTYLHELMPEVPAQTGAIGFGIPALFLSLLPLLSNFDGCSQAGHWFGYNYGADMMRPMDKNAVYWGGSDPGRFIPTYMAFVESQQDDRWKKEPGFDRRDVTVITQNALCDTYYAHYIRDQYDPRFRPKIWTPFEKWLGRDRAYPEVPVYCASDEELSADWSEYENRPEVQARVQAGGTMLRPGSNDVFDINGIVAQKMFERNKKDHTFYLEQSVPMAWTYSYMLPSGLIFRLNPEPMSDDEFAARPEIAEDRKFWDAYSQKLLNDPRFRMDTDAILNYSKLAFWHSDLYRVRHMEKEQEYWLKMALALCPQASDSVNSLAHLYMDQQHFDEAVAVVKQAMLDDPRNDAYPDLLKNVNQVRVYGQREKELRSELAKSPYDVQLNLDLARLLQDEGKLAEVNERLQEVAGLTNWDHEGMADIVQYYVGQAHNPQAAIAFLEARAKIDPKADQMIYSLAAIEASVGQKEAALKYLAQAESVGGTNVIVSAKIDPRFAALHDDPRFQAILSGTPLTNTPSANAPPTNFPATNAPATSVPSANPPATNPPASHPKQHKPGKKP